MDRQVTEYFAELIKLASDNFDKINYINDVTPKRAILRMQGQYGSYRVIVTELLDDVGRKYSYYVLNGDRVEAGFDNSPDPRAIRLKYGKISSEHTGECVPHLHLEDKNRLVLTEEMTFGDFVDWLLGNLTIMR